MHTRKLRHLNYEHIETMPLIKSKKNEHVAALDKNDSWNHFKIAMTKWNFFFTNVMVVGLFQNMKNGPISKEKWGSIVRDFKNCFDYMSRTWHKQRILISMSLQDKVPLHLPKFFNRNIIDVVLEKSINLFMISWVTSWKIKMI